MVSWVVTGANRGIGVSCSKTLSIHNSYRWPLLDSSDSSRNWSVSTYQFQIVHCIYSCLQSSDSNNIVFALTRNKANSTDLLELASKFGNVHVHQADITDVPSLRVSPRFLYFLHLILRVPTKSTIGCCAGSRESYRGCTRRVDQQWCLPRCRTCWLVSRYVVSFLHHR